MALLKKVVALEHEADEFGFRWENTDQIMAQIQSELLEIKEHFDDLGGISSKELLQEEIGDLLHAVFSLCVFCQFSPTQTLEKTLTKFERRLGAVKELAVAEGLTNLKGYSFDELMAFWSQAKKIVG